MKLPITTMVSTSLNIKLTTNVLSLLPFCSKMTETRWFPLEDLPTQLHLAATQNQSRTTWMDPHCPSMWQKWLNKAKLGWKRQALQQRSLTKILLKSKSLSVLLTVSNKFKPRLTQLCCNWTNLKRLWTSYKLRVLLKTLKSNKQRNSSKTG